MKLDNSHDKKYAGEAFYWGKKPSEICSQVLEVVKPSDDFHPKLIDLGSGEGRNAVYFAQRGFDVLGLEISSAGLEKTKQLAKEVDVDVRTVQADMIPYNPNERYDAVFSVGSLHYVPPDARIEWFKRWKAATTLEGIHVMSTFVRKPFIARAPDSETTAYPYLSGELLAYYWDWEILYCVEDIFDCMSAGIPHKHAFNAVAARRYCQGE